MHHTTLEEKPPEQNQTNNKQANTQNKNKCPENIMGDWQCQQFAFADIAQLIVLATSGAKSAVHCAIAATVKNSAAFSRSLKR